MSPTKTGKILDCLIIGGGPAGLASAIYLGRFRRNVIVIDAGESRAALIPRSRNLAGFPDGIPGKELLARMKHQAEKHGVHILAGRVTSLSRSPNGFCAEADGQSINARTVVLASGVIDGKLPFVELEKAIENELVRYCPICDGYEARDSKIAVIGYGHGAVEEALFLRTYSEDITLLSLGEALHLDENTKRRLIKSNIKTIDAEVTKIEIQPPRVVTIETKDGTKCEFDTLYSALGSQARTELIRPLGTKLFGDNCVEVDLHMRTNIEGLYAAGDVIKGLDQISTALGNSAIAATSIHNYLKQIAAVA